MDSDDIVKAYEIWRVGQRLRAADCLSPMLHESSDESGVNYSIPMSLPCTREIRNQALLIGDLLDVAWHLANVHHEPIDENHPRQGIIFYLTSYGSLKVEGVLNIVIRSRYERDLDHLQ